MITMYMHLKLFLLLNQSFQIIVGNSRQRVINYKSLDQFWHSDIIDFLFIQIVLPIGSMVCLS